MTFVAELSKTKDMLVSIKIEARGGSKAGDLAQVLQALREAAEEVGGR